MCGNWNHFIKRWTISNSKPHSLISHSTSAVATTLIPNKYFPNETNSVMELLKRKQIEPVRNKSQMQIFDQWNKTWSFHNVWQKLQADTNCTIKMEAPDNKLWNSICRLEERVRQYPDSFSQKQVCSSQMVVCSTSTNRSWLKITTDVRKGRST